LRIISSSPGELELVFNAILENATRICEANFGTLYRFDGNNFDLAAQVGAPAEYANFLKQRGPFRQSPRGLLDRMLATKRVALTGDATAEAHVVSEARLGGARSAVCAPLLKENEPIGAIIVYRQEVRPFSKKQIELLTIFAAQAVIAIENARLLNELRQRTADLSESLEQQTASSEVLKVISASPGNLEPVFAIILENATRICEANFGTLLLCEGDHYRQVAFHNAPPAFVAARRSDPMISMTGDTALARLAATKQHVHIADVTNDPAYQIDAQRRRFVTLTGVRTNLAAPMLKDNELIGAINIYRQEVNPFTDKQIALLQNFAAQAVIAIENARLLNEVRQSLEQQTASANVLRIISSSPGELQPVFEAMLQNAVRICDARFGSLALLGSDGFRFVALHGAPPKYRDTRQREPFIGSGNRANLSHVLKTKQVVQIADIAAEEPDISLVKDAGARTLINVPMLNDDDLVGIIAIYRQEVRPFTELEQQTATANVLHVISSSPGDLKPVFEVMLQNAVRVCDAKFGTLFRFDGKAFHFVEEIGTPPQPAEWHKRGEDLFCRCRAATSNTQCRRKR
jgi:GAF domain-containing protein